MRETKRVLLSDLKTFRFVCNSCGIAVEISLDNDEQVTRLLSKSSCHFCSNGSIVNNQVPPNSMEHRPVEVLRQALKAVAKTPGFQVEVVVPLDGEES